jgi:hypothetical protein
MEMSKRTGGHGRNKSTGKGMEEENGMERRGGNMTTRMATIETRETGEDTTIKPGPANPNESSGEIIQCPYFSRAAS